MTMQPLSLVEGLTRSWAHLYTVAMPAAPQTSRRREIACDLWEHGEAARAAGQGPVATAGEVLGRLLRGMPSDLLWRLQGGDFEMNLKFGIERSTGVLMLMVVLMTLASVIGSTGVGSDEPYFTYDFPSFANDLGADTRTLIFRFALVPVTIVASVLLFVTFRAQTPRFAAAGAAALALSGSLFLAGAVAGVRLHTLADVWRDGGVPRDSVWFAARDAASYVEVFGFSAVLALAVSFVGFGGAMARTAAMPRWVGRYSLGAAGVMVLGSVGLIASVDAFWFVLMLGTLGVLSGFVITGGWLVLKGAGKSAGPSSGTT